MSKSIIIRPKDIMMVYACSPATATRKMQLLRDVYHKKKHQAVTVNEFCKYFDIPVNEVKQALRIA